MNKIIKSYWPAIIWSAIILILLSIPGKDLPEETHFLNIPYFDKWVHFGIFAAFVWLWCRGIYRIITPSKNIRATYTLIAIAGTLLGYAMELVQKYWIPNRDYDLWDVVADGLGCFTGLVFSLIIFRKK
ncbi:MAG: VanZ family protein [Niabella sp.]